MLLPIFALALIVSDPPASRFARPAPPAQAATLAAEEKKAIALARAAVADMKRIAITPDEKRLADTDSRIVEAIAALVERRARQRKAFGAGVAELPGMDGGLSGDSASTGAGSSSAIGAAADGSGQDQLLNATKQMQETQMSFNLQYLQLQSQMQSENRSYTAVSNIMKTKHDTVKNSISNIR